ncbi:MAG: hypothetical protein IKJ43_00590 [Bacilli bacterium]|nr:hypothetical protein [Bacilli bacterium]
MQEKDVYREMINMMDIAANQDLNNAINMLDQAINSIKRGISIDGIAYKVRELEELRNEAVDKRDYINDVLIPSARSEMEACDDEV